MKKHNISTIVLLIVTFLMLVSWFLPDADWAYIVKLVLWVAEFVLVLIAIRDKSTSLKVVLISTLALMLLTWILPAAYYSSGQYIDQGHQQMGLFDLFNYPVTALSYFGYIAFFVLAIGAFYGILNKIPAYRTFLDKFVSKVRGTEKFVLVIIILLLAVLTSIGGMQLALLALFPMLVSIILLMGFDKMVAAMTLVGSVMIGMAGSTYAYGNTNIILTILSINITSEMITKVVILVLGLVLLIANIMLYIKKTDSVTKVIAKDSKKNMEKEDKKLEVKETKVVKEEKTTKSSSSSKTTKSTSKSSKSSKSNSKNGTKKNTKSSSRKNIKAAVKDEEVIVVKEAVNGGDAVTKLVPSEVSTQHNIWPFSLMFILFFVLLVLAYLPWVNGFGVNAFTDATKAVSEFELFGFPIFGKLLGTVNSFGNWTVVDMLLPMALIILFLALVYKVKVQDVLDGALAGIKKALPLGLIVVLLYACLVIVTYHPFQLVIYKTLLGVIDKFGVVGALMSSLVAMLASIFNVDPSYAFQSVLIYLASVVTDNTVYPVIGVIFQAMYGFTMLFAPTSVILMVVLSYLDIPYTKWIKTIWKLLLEVLVVLLIVFILLVVL